MRSPKIDLRRNYDRVKAAICSLLQSDGLRAKAVRGGAWLGAGSVVEQVVRFARNIVLARLLAPEAFGTMAIVLSSAAIVENLTDVGVNAAIIQNPRGGEEAYLNSSWWLGMVRAICSYSIIFAIAPWVSRFFGHADLSGLIRVALLSTLFYGAISPRSALVQREMKFSRWAVITNGGGICGVIVAVVLSYFIRDVWALAVGYCSENAFRCVLSYALCPGLPSRRWEWHAVRELLAFSKGIYGLAFLTLIIGRTDIFVLGKLFSPTALGLYTMAISLVVTPSSFFTSMLGQSLMPALCSVQGDTERVNRILVEVTSWLILLGLPAAVSISLCAPSLLTVLFGARYVTAAGSLSVASSVVFLTVLHAATTCVLFAKGRPGLHRYAVGVTAAMMLVAIYPACRLLGPVGGRVAALLAIVVGYLFQLVRLRSLTGLKLLRYGSAFVPAAMGSAGIIGVVLGSRHLGLITRPSADVALCFGSYVIAFVLCASAHLRALSRTGELYRAKIPESAAVL